VSATTTAGETATAGATTFGDRLAEALTRFGPLCVGIDPHEHLLRDWGLDASAAGAREFGLRVVEAAAGHVGIVKPQVSFFERYGSAGFAALEDVLAAGRAAGLVVIADAKRGDIGTTMDGYAAAWLAIGAPLEADAVTLSPYLGPQSLRDTVATAAANGKGVFVLAATSNPEAIDLQSAVIGGDAPRQTVAQRVVTEVAAFDRDHRARLGSVGVVIGATVARDALGLDDQTLRGIPVLAPGFGAQGAVARDLVRLFGALAPDVIASESRSILHAGPDAIAETIVARAGEYASAHA
jgi:orotidine-5'-phosphate decarboxylase